MLRNLRSSDRLKPKVSVVICRWSARSMWGQPPPAVLRAQLDFLSENATQFLRRINLKIWSLHLKRVWSKPISDGDSPQSGIATGTDVHMRIANNCSLLRPHTRFTHQFQRTLGFGFLRGEAVPAINLREESAQP